MLQLHATPLSFLPPPPELVLVAPELLHTPYGYEAADLESVFGFAWATAAFADSNSEGGN